MTIKPRKITTQVKVKVANDPPVKLFRDRTQSVDVKFESASQIFSKMQQIRNKTNARSNSLVKESEGGKDHLLSSNNRRTSVAAMIESDSAIEKSLDVLSEHPEKKD